MNDEAIPAATLIVVRDRQEGPPELLMVERSKGMAFAAGAWVFPGGRIDEGDRELGNACGLDPAAVAAIRETVEETAVPLGLAPWPDPSTAHALQDGLLANQMFADLLHKYGLEFDPAALTPFARWVPKFHAVRRFDTLFFIGKCIERDLHPRVIAGECASVAWLSAAELLERERRGEARLIFPTRRNLERLALHSRFEDMRADALAHPVEPVTPWVEEQGGEKFITIPSHLGYPITREKLEGVWRG